MMLTGEEVSHLLTLYREDIRLVLALFKHRFGPGNPVHRWRNGYIPRVGYLDAEHTMEYSLHGAGCTVDLSDTKYVSFDWDETDTPSFDSWKFSTYVESLGVEVILPPENEIRFLAAKFFFPI